MVRQIIKIDEEKCNGCGICATACHEGAIGLIDGKAKLLRDDYCDGLGDCLPSCPVGAISFETREAEAYDEKAVAEHMYRKKQGDMTTEKQQGQELEAGKQQTYHPVSEIQQMTGNDLLTEGHGCPGSRIRQMNRAIQNPAEQTGNDRTLPAPCTSQLGNWPVQIKLAPVKAPYFEGSKLLIAADCTAYSYANFHQEFIKGKVTLIGCPKLDEIDYREKLTEIIRQNDIQSVTIVRMEVPCCGGLEMAAKKALQESGKFIPWQVVTISIDGSIL